MTPFEHLAVLISIVIGLGITQLLMATYRLVQARRRVRFYWLSLLWAILLFISQVEWWWASYELRGEAQWKFFYFLFILLSPVSLFLAAAFVLPDVEKDEQLDMRAYYYGNRGWLFTLLALSPAFDAIRRGVSAGNWRDFGAVSNAISAALLCTMAITRRAWYHVAVTLFVAGLFIYFIISAALQLR